MRTQHRLYKIKDMYVDDTIIKDASCSLLFELATYHKITLHLVLPNEACLEDVKQYDSFGYIANVVYGDRASAYALAHHKTTSQEQIAIFERIENQNMVSCMGVCYHDVGCFLNIYSKQERHIKRWLIALYASLIVYFTIYFYNFDTLPIYLRTGWTLLLFLLFPACALMLGMLYGIHRRIFSIWQLLDWI